MGTSARRRDTAEKCEVQHFSGLPPPRAVCSVFSPLAASPTPFTNGVPTDQGSGPVARVPPPLSPAV